MSVQLHQEIEFIRMINQWIGIGYLPTDRFKHVKLRFIQMLYELDKESKMDRRPLFIRCMMEYGERQAKEVLMELP